jgi:hypothetical protein
MPQLSTFHRRVVLVDFDWQDADLMPRLLSHPGVSVRLVAGQDQDNAGLRLAEMCGLPRTTDLGDLTREIFDIALLSQRSPRRAQVEGLLTALGTLCWDPAQFLEAQEGNGTASPPTPPLASQTLPTRQLETKAVELEGALSGRDVNDLLAEGLPSDGEAPAPPRPKPVRPRILRVLNLEEFPSPEDRLGLEMALRAIAASTGADHAELRVGGAEALDTVAGFGPSDPLTEALVRVAFEQNKSQVVTNMTGPNSGRGSGAWPFRTTQRRGVIAATGFDPQQGYQLWQKLVEELRETWDLRDRERAGAAFPMVPDRRSGWSAVEEFSDGLELAVERNRRDGLRFTLHRLQFPSRPEAVERLCALLPEHLRDRDVMARPQPQIVMLLTAGPREGFPQLQKRLTELWEQCWREVGAEPPAPAVRTDTLELASPETSALFLATSRAWLHGGH